MGWTRRADIILTLNLPESWTRLFWRRFGRSTRAPLDITRILFGIASLIPCIGEPMHAAAGASLACIGVGVFTFWAFLVAAMPLLSGRFDEAIRRAVLLIDFVVIAALIAIHHPMIIYTLPYAMLLFLNLAVDLLRILQRIVVLVLVLLIAIFGFSAQPLLLGGHMSAERALERGLFVAMSILVLVAYGARRTYRQRFRRWADGLLIAGTHARTVPIGFLAQQIAAQSGSRGIAWIENAHSTASRLWQHEGDTLVEAALPEREWASASPWLQQSGTFLFDAKRMYVFNHVEGGMPKATQAPALLALAGALSAQPCGASFPIRLADVSARVFVFVDERPSLPALSEAVRLGHAIEAVFERFMFQNAWRGRAVAEARLELGADLHDTVLQTMASLRMQIAGLLVRSQFNRDAEIRNALEDLQSTVAEEQRTFREILNESRRAAREPVDLVALLEHRINALSAQWNIECSFQPSSATLMVDADAAVEVEFIIREVVSNAVQHTSVKRMAIRTSLADHALMLSVRSMDRLGRATDDDGSPVSSRSLARRLTYLGASAYADETSPGGLISIRIPMARG
jgi:two-component system, NarL family, nitrate/nitrite sensor histidine kinase NarX